MKENQGKKTRVTYTVLQCFIFLPLDEEERKSVPDSDL